VSRPLRSCTVCHTDADSDGRKAAAAFREQMQSITARTAMSERILLTAQRGGVETKKARTELDAAIDGEIDLQVLVHGFNPKGEFATKQAETLKHADAAAKAGRAAIGELTYRRKGLLVALGLIALMLVLLGLKIRDLSASEEQK
jgi:hypothetical protein